MICVYSFKNVNIYININPIIYFYMATILRWCLVGSLAGVVDSNQSVKRGVKSCFFYSFCAFFLQKSN